MSHGHAVRQVQLFETTLRSTSCLQTGTAKNTELSRADPLRAAAGGRLIYEHLCIREQTDKTLPRFDIHRTNRGLVKYLQNACNNVSAFYHHRRHQISHQIPASKTVLKRSRQQLSHLSLEHCLDLGHTNIGLYLQSGIFKFTSLAPMQICWDPKLFY